MWRGRGMTSPPLPIGLRGPFTARLRPRSRGGTSTGTGNRSKEHRDMQQQIVGAVIALAVAGGGALGASAQPERPGWQALFDGATLNGWKASEHPESWSVKDGTLSCNGERSHLFYVGTDGQAQFTDFEAELEVLT